MGQSRTEKLIVSVRIRPPRCVTFGLTTFLNCHSSDTTVSAVPPATGRQAVIVVPPGGTDRTFVVDHLFDAQATQRTVHEGCDYIRGILNVV